MPKTNSTDLVANPLSHGEPQLVQRLLIAREYAIDLLLDRMAADSLRDESFRSACKQPTMGELKASIQILRVLTNNAWDRDDMRLFNAFWREACVSELFGEEFEAERHRIMATMTLAQCALETGRLF